MNYIGKVVFTGNVGRDAPKLNFTKEGVAVASVSFAVTRGYGDNKLTTWIKVSIWRDKAEKFVELVGPGQPLLLECDGLPKIDSWMTQDGEYRSQLHYNIETYRLLNKRDATHNTEMEKKPENPSSSKRQIQNDLDAFFSEEGVF